jgi:hypothetical protein
MIMHRNRRFKFFATLVLIQILLALPGLVWPKYLDSPIGIVIVLPFLSVYIFHSLGIPGLLQNNGACGWGWCAPTPFGWVFIGAVWLLELWAAAWVLSKVIPEANPTKESIG